LRYDLGKSQNSQKKIFWEYRPVVQIGIPFSFLTKRPSKLTLIDLKKIWV
jgi:hypothetical protein